jgi:hypothetical protein
LLLQQAHSYEQEEMSECHPVFFKKTRCTPYWVDDVAVGDKRKQQQNS